MTWILLLALLFFAYIVLMPLLAHSKATQALRELQDLRTRLAAQFGPASKDAAPRTSAPLNAQPPASPTSAPLYTEHHPKAASPERAQGWEHSIGANWSVWVGAVALTVGTVLLIKYMIDAGVLSPAVRCILGGVLGGALIAVGEGLNRKGWARPLPGMTAASVPEAVVAAGIAAIYASVNIAAGLYDLIGPGVAFVILAVVSMGAIALSLRHRILLALVGLAGAYLVPALVQSDQPWALVLFGYLAIVTATCQALVWHRNWPYLKALQIGAAAL